MGERHAPDPSFGDDSSAPAWRAREHDTFPEIAEAGRRALGGSSEKYAYDSLRSAFSLSLTGSRMALMRQQPAWKNIRPRPTGTTIT